jgi:ubiquitin C-terminal hydrolase
VSNSNLSSTSFQNQKDDFNSAPEQLSKMIRPSTTKITDNSNSNYLLLSKKVRKLLPFNSGIKNHGNTCFMNCVLQSLFNCSPLCDYFVTEHYERDIQLINYQRQYGNLTSSTNSFILTRHFNRLLNSLWRNAYDSNNSAELKELIGRLNQTFAGTNQNDSHEFCVWLLDRLSQELTYNNPLASKIDENDGTG